MVLKKNKYRVAEISKPLYQESSLNRIKNVSEARFFSNFDYKISTVILYVCLPEGALTSFTVWNAYRYFVGPV